LAAVTFTAELDRGKVQAGRQLFVSICNMQESRVLSHTACGSGYAIMHRREMPRELLEWLTVSSSTRCNMQWSLFCCRQLVLLFACSQLLRDQLPVPHTHKAA
jgi:hypothetical protein